MPTCPKPPADCHDGSVSSNSLTSSRVRTEGWTDVLHCSSTIRTLNTNQLWQPPFDKRSRNAFDHILRDGSGCS